MIAGLGVAFWQQATGVEAAVYYTPETLERAGIRDEGALLLATVGIGCVKVAFILLAACLVERAGRVTLLRCSTGGILLAQLLLGLSFSLGKVRQRPPRESAALVGPRRALTRDVAPPSMICRELP